MTKFKSALLLLAAFALGLVVALTSGCATAPMTNGIPNLAQVEPGVWRGGQPTAAGWAWLKTQGVHFDLKLNEECDTNEQSSGLEVRQFPISFAEQMGFGKDLVPLVENAEWSLDLCRYYKSDGGVFVHCEHGQDRTGLIIGAYRVNVEHWKKADAYKEMLANGFHPALFGLQRYWDKEVHEK